MIDSTVYGAVRPKWDKNDCSVRALAVAGGCSYEVASAIYSAFGRQLKKGTPTALTRKILEEGLKARPVTFMVGVPISHMARTMAKGRYVVHRRRHALAIVDGVVHDWEGGGQGVVFKAWLLEEEGLAVLEKMKRLIGG